MDKHFRVWPVKKTDSTWRLKPQHQPYRFTLKKGLAFMFLMLFLNGFVAESFSYKFTDFCQSELVDFENEKDSEDDAKKEKEKENKILTSIDELLNLDANLRNKAYLHAFSLNEQIQEVLSPPPELT